MKQFIDRHVLIENKGYTLIEVLVVISIMAILFTVGYAGYREFSRRQVLIGAVNQVQGDLRKAQQLALSGVKPNDPKCNSPELLNGYIFVIDSSGTAYSIQSSCTGGNVQSEDLVNLPLGISISISSGPLMFKVIGSGTNISNEDTVLTVSQGATGDSRTITIGSGGDIK